MKTQVDDEDFEQLNRDRWHLTPKGYAARHSRKRDMMPRRYILIHRFIMKVNDGRCIDHIDRDKLNNQKSNLRITDRTKNVRNCVKRKSNTSGYKGVFQRKDKWRAGIRVDRKMIWLGTFNDKEAAANAYDDAAIKYHKDFACTNF